MASVLFVHGRRFLPTAATVDQLHSILFGVAITSYTAILSAKRHLNNGRRRAYRRGHRLGCLIMSLNYLRKEEKFYVFIIVIATMAAAATAAATAAAAAAQFQLN